MENVSIDVIAVKYPKSYVLMSDMFAKEYAKVKTLNINHENRERVLQWFISEIFNGNYDRFRDYESMTWDFLGLRKFLVTYSICRIWLYKIQNYREWVGSTVAQPEHALIVHYGSDWIDPNMKILL